MLLLRPHPTAASLSVVVRSPFLGKLACHICRIPRAALLRKVRRNCSKGGMDPLKLEGVSPRSQKAPVLLIDIMDTLVRDPFYDDIPAFFGLTMPELLAEKHPTAWIEFEMGLLTEEELLKRFFRDGRVFDYRGLKECMTRGYCYLEGVEQLLERLQAAGYSMHAFSNYPCWYSMIEEKLQLSRYLPWTFVSCHTGLRKPDAKAYLEAAQHLNLNPSSCIFIDDRPKNVEAASQVGMVGIRFQNAKKLEVDLAAIGICL